MRKIIHIDMDAFFASIEQRDNPELRGKPVAVGFPGDRGVVAAASYEARRYGVRSAMSSKAALRRCPQLIFVRSRFDKYKAVSRQIMNIFHEYTDIIEPLSLDEAFLDVTENLKNITSATEVAKEIKARISEETRLTASAGVSFNKFLAKIASDYNKPDGLFVIKPKQAEKFVEQLPIEQFFGVGKITAKKMHRFGIKTGWDLKQRTETELVNLFGKAGHIYYQNARAIDEREVNPNRIRKSIGAENTFETDIDSIGILKNEMKGIAEDVISRIKKNSFLGRTITLKIKYADFKIITRSKTLTEHVTDVDTLYQTGYELLQSIDLSPKIRLMGLTIKTNESQIWTDAIQLELDFKE
ncbi:MAG: DNA polymerase IV [Dysgonomonas sp.]